MSSIAWIERVRRSPSPLVARQLARARIRAGDVRLEDLDRLDALRPDDLDFEPLEDPVAELRLADAAPPVRLATAERGAKTIVLSFTASDLERAAASGAAAFRAAGIEAGMKVANTLEGGLEASGSLLVGDALERLGALDVPLGPVRDEASAAAIHAMIERVGVDVLVLDDTSASALMPLLRRTPPRAWRGTIWLGGGLPRELPGWCRRWISLPELAPFFAVACRLGVLHVDRDVSISLREGRLRSSALTGDAPLFSYEPGIDAASIRERCACGDARVALDLGEI